MNDNKFISILADTTMKYLMKKKETRDIYLELFSDIIGIDLTNYILVDNELNSGNNIKELRLDLLLENGDILVNIEINNQIGEYTSIKNLTYAFRLAGSRHEKGNNYYDKQVIQINLNREKFTNGTGVLLYELRNKNYDLVKKGVKIYDVYLENYKDICYNGDNKNEMLLSMLTAKDNNSLKRIVNSNKEGIVIMDELDRLRKDDKFNAYYGAEKVNEMTRETAYLEGIDKGKLAGEREKQIEIARKLKALSMSDNDISNVTGLSLEELDKIVKKI